jgi:hypothetical protein
VEARAQKTLHVMLPHPDEDERYQTPAS